MKRLLAMALSLPLSLPGQAFAKAMERPIPQPQTHQAELWFLGASLALIGALVAVQMLVNRR
jgi:hypothetical protein